MLNVFKNKFSQIHKQSKEAKELLRFIGPGILVTVGFIDPGNWAANLAAGADYGYALLWVVTLSTLMLILLQHNVAIWASSQVNVYRKQQQDFYLSVFHVQFWLLLLWRRRQLL